MVQGHGLDNSSGLLMVKAVVKREASKEIAAAGTKHGLTFYETRDPTVPDLIMLEAIGQLELVEHLAKDLVAAGYQRLPEL